MWADAVRRNPRLAFVNNELAGAKQSSGKLEETSSHEKQADQFTPNDPLYHWVLGRRLQDPGMTDLAENICSKQADSRLRKKCLANVDATLSFEAHRSGSFRPAHPQPRCLLHVTGRMPTLLALTDAGPGSDEAAVWDGAALLARR